MNRHLGLAMVIAVSLVAAPAAAQKVIVDYSPLADFGNYKSFAWTETPRASIHDHNPLNHSRIKHAVEYYLIKGGMIEDTENPDLYVTYYGDTDTEFSINMKAVGYGFPSDWTWDPYWGTSAGTMTSTPVEHKAGTLVIDIWEADSQKLIWRGSMSGALTDNLQKGAKAIDKGIQKMVKKWQKMRAKELK